MRGLIKNLCAAQYDIVYYEWLIIMNLQNIERVVKYGVTCMPTVQVFFYRSDMSLKLVKPGCKHSEN